MFVVSALLVVAPENGLAKSRPNNRDQPRPHAVSQDEPVMSFAQLSEISGRWSVVGLAMTRRCRMRSSMVDVRCRVENERPSFFPFPRKESGLPMICSEGSRLIDGGFRVERIQLA